jgi:CheY-like chemotaxis protein
MPKVLVIDDDAAVRRIVSKMLARAGHETREAADGAEGMRALLRERFELVITDLFMPGQEGIETIGRIREIDTEIPIIAISGSSQDDHFSPLGDAKVLGADRAVEKPFTVEQLLAAVQELLTPP